jgi:hypothetical protein
MTFSRHFQVETDMSDNKGSEERIRDRAYALWEQEGRPQGREREHWEQAAREVQDGGAAASSATDVRQQPGPAQAEGRPSVDQRTASEATGATIGGRTDGAARRPGSEPEARSRKPL